MTALEIAMLFFWFVPEVEAFFICLRGRAKEEVAYEVLPNYDSPGFPSSYWNEVRRGRLSKESQEACQECYPLPSRGAGMLKVMETPEIPVRKSDHAEIQNTVNTVYTMCVALTQNDSEG